MTPRHAALIAGLLILAGPVRAQEEAETKATAEGAEEGMRGTHRITLGLGHIHVAEGQVEGDKSWLVAPSWSLNYDYWLGNKWAIGLQNDLILESFVIEKGDELIERNYPVAIVPVVLYRPLKHFTFVGGVGAEIASEQTLVLTRLAVELGWEVGKRWEVGGALVWDAKWDYYDSWGISFSVSRFFGGKH